MELFEDKVKFNDAIAAASAELNISEVLLEKDYFVMLILSKLNKNIDGLLFKGGTSCSHAYNVIKRFSEDIDLTLNENYIGRNHNIRANKAIVKTCDEMNFNILNRNEVLKHSHGNYNCYYIEYPSMYRSNLLRPFIQIGMVFYIKSFPFEYKAVNSILNEWLRLRLGKDTMGKICFSPFDVCVQKLERTFVDKIFAICDYYERNEQIRNSRHIYDCYKISKVISLQSKDLKKLVKEVRKARQNDNRCISASDNYDINSKLLEIVNSDYYKKDYYEITSKLLMEDIAYEEAVKVLEDVIATRMFEET